jgi:hypothetical protein
MVAKRRIRVSLLEGKKSPRRVQMKFTAGKEPAGRRLVSFLKGKKAPRRTHVSFMVKLGRSARKR